MTHCMNIATKPIFDVAAHATLGDLEAWITDPPGMVDHVADGARLTAEMATYLTTDVDRMMRERWPDASKFVYVHDFSRVIGYDNEAIQILAEWGRVSMKHVAAIIVIVDTKTDFMTRVGAYGATKVLNICGVPIDTSASMSETIKRFELKTAAM